mgnify:FL=1
MIKKKIKIPYSGDAFMWYFYIMKRVQQVVHVFHNLLTKAIKSANLGGFCAVKNTRRGC